MTRPLILSGIRAASLCLSLCVFPAIAHADVLEIGANGAQWISGARAAGKGPAAPIVTDTVPPDIAVPGQALADADAPVAELPPAYAAKVLELAARYDLSPALIEAVVWQESRWQPGAVSPKGATGLTQLMPGTARQMGVDPRDPYANLEGGARYLREQLNRFDGDLEKALAAYNAGPGRVERAGGIPSIRETQAYVAAIMSRLSNYSRSENP